MNKRVWSLALTVSLTLSLMTPPAYAAFGEDRTESTYAQEERSTGREHTVGVNEDPRTLFEQGIVNDGDTIILEGTRTVNELKGQGQSDASPWVIDKRVTIKGKGGNGNLVLRPGGILLAADVTFEDITLTFSNGIRSVIMANGHTLRLHNVTKGSTGRDIHLACGGLTGHIKQYEATYAPGDHGEIIISGSTALGNIYAGSIAYGDMNMDGIPNVFARPSTITIDKSATGLMGTVYASGAEEAKCDPKQMLNPQYKVDPPRADAGQYRVTGDVTINLYDSAVRNVDGRTGGSQNAQITYQQGQYPNNTTVLSHVDRLSVQSGELTPAAGSSLTNANASISVSSGATLSLVNLGENLTTGNFTGGGTVILGKNQTWTIDGTVASDTTEVGIGEIFGGTSQAMPQTGHTYIQAKNSVEGSFKLIPHNGNPNMSFTRTEQGAWLIPGSPSATILVEQASIQNSYVAHVSEYVEIPVNVTYSSPDAFSLAHVPVDIYVNDVKATRAGSADKGFSYMLSSQGIGLMEFGRVDDGERLFVEGSGMFRTLNLGIYNIRLVIPAASMANQKDHEMVTTLTIYDQTPPAPSDVDLKNATVSVNGSFIYNGQEQTPPVTVRVGDQVLEQNVHYTLTYAENVNAGSATITVQAVPGSGYTGSATAAFTIQKARLSLENATVEKKVYDGTKEVTVTGVSFLRDSSVAENLQVGKDYVATGAFNDANVNAANQVTVTVNLMGSAAANYELAQPVLVMNGQSMDKAAIPPRAGQMTVSNHRAGRYTYELTQLLSDLEGSRTYGSVAYTLDKVELGDYYTAGGSIDGTTLTIPVVSVDSDVEQDIGTVSVQITTDNYEVTDAVITVRAVNKEVPQGTPELSLDTLTYGELLSSIQLSGQMTDIAGQPVAGSFAWSKPDTQYAAGSHQAEWVFTPADTERYMAVTGTVELTVKKAVPTGTPAYTPIVMDNKTLADAALTTEGGSFTVPGTVKWEKPETTVVEENTSYGWIFTPQDTTNYQLLTGTLVPYSVSSGGGGSSSGGSSSGHSSTEKHPDGSTTTVETKPNGTVIETTKQPDGSFKKVETQKDGTVTETNQTANGTSGVIVTDTKGNVTQVSGTISEKDAKQAQEQDQAVKLPVEVPVADSTAWAPNVKIQVPKGGAAVAIPVKHATPGTVAIMIHPDGTEEVVKKSVLTDQGVALSLDETATLKLVDNSQHFADVKALDWYREAVDFISARGLMSGTGNDSFAPNAPLSRGMLATILYSLEDQPKTSYVGNFQDVEQGSWYSDAVHWAAEVGVLSGYGNGTIAPDENITREQLAVMLHRYAGSPEAASSLHGFNDAHATSLYARQAMVWAVEQGIVGGQGNGILNPQGQATRAEVAQMIKTFMS